MIIKIINKIDQHFEEFFCAIMLGYIAVSLNIEVFNRYILFSPSAFTDEIARMLMLFIVFLGVPWAVKNNRHIVIDLWSDKLSPQKTLLFDFLSNGIFLVFAIVFASAAFDAVEFHKMLGSKTEALGFEYWIQLSILPFSFALTCVRLTQKLIEAWRNYREVTATIDENSAATVKQQLTQEGE